MKISYNWLEEYVELGQSPEELSDLLTMAGLEVDEVLSEGPDFSGVVVGHVLEVRKHPNADRLSVCMVDIGGEEPEQIICGAPNVAPEQRVAVATVGTTLHLPDRKKPGTRVPVAIKRAKIRGERSAGMICAEDELGISEDHSGIIVLDDGAPIGQAFSAYLQSKGVRLADSVFDIDITPNRQDAISHIGVARDVAALTKKQLRVPDVQVPGKGGTITKDAKIVIRSPEGCGRYVACLVHDVRVGESPQWMKDRLEAVGLRSINNIVDITNYVMYECGQPLHGFDFDQLAKGTIIVEATDRPSRFRTLDDVERELPEGTLMICDTDRPVAIAGVMGGENSEVTGQTRNVLIESAFFDPASIRGTSRALGLQSDASYRFERGVDPENSAWAAVRAAELMCSIAGGTLVEGIIDEHPMEPFSRQIRLRESRIGAILGVDVSTDLVESNLEAIGFNLTRDPATASWLCEVPSYRRDVEREIDIIEEIARLYGYDRIPEPERGNIAYATPRRDVLEAWRERTVGVLSGLGFREIYTNSLLSEAWAGRFSPSGPEAAVGTVNSVSQGMTTLRPALLPGVLRVVAHNQNHGRRSTRFVEFGHVFELSGTEDTLIPGYIEREHLLLVLSGELTPDTFDGATQVADVFDMKGAVETVCMHLGIDHISFSDRDGYPETDYCLNIEVRGAVVGFLGKLATQTEQELDLRYPAFFAELDWGRLVPHGHSSSLVQYESISRFPTVERDLAVVVSDSTSAGEIAGVIRRVGGSLLKDTVIFDIYEGDQIAAGKKSIAFRLRFGTDRTLVDREVDAQIERIVRELMRSHQAELR